MSTPTRPRELLAPASWLLLFAAAAFVFHQAPAFAGEPAGDVIDLLTPFAMIGSAAGALVTLEARGRILVAAGIAAILYVDGHGIHLSANSINNEGPGPEVEDLVHFWDETFSHIVAVLGWFGLIACIAWAEGSRGAKLRLGATAKITGATALLLGWALFTGTVEGGTWPMELAAAAAFAIWWLREGRGGRRPLLSASAAAFALGALLIGVWAAWHGGVPQFSETGFI